MNMRLQYLEVVHVKRLRRGLTRNTQEVFVMNMCVMNMRSRLRLLSGRCAVARPKSKQPCSAVSEVKGNELKLQWLLRCQSKARQSYLQTCANCRS